MNEVSRVEEWVNSLTHYFGVILALVGTGALLVRTLESGNIGYFYWFNVILFLFNITLFHVWYLSYIIYW